GGREDPVVALGATGPPRLRLGAVWGARLEHDCDERPDPLRRQRLKYEPPGPKESRPPGSVHLVGRARPPAGKQSSADSDPPAGSGDRMVKAVTMTQAQTRVKPLPPLAQRRSHVPVEGLA